MLRDPASLLRISRKASIANAAMAALAVVMAGVPGSASAEDFANFESAHVHPVALSADSQKLLVVNTPDSRLSIFEIGAEGALSLSSEVPVGIDPVSLAVHGGEVWVVNHISDSISVVDVATERIVETIQTGDEPTDIVFAAGRAFVSLAGNRDHLRIYDAASRAEVAQLDIFGDDPRSLAVSEDGTEVYLVVLESGNLTSSIHFGRVVAGGGPPAPSPPKAPPLPAAPETALIVKFDPNAGTWIDEAGTSWADSDELLLADHDLFVIDTSTLSLSRTVSTVGTTLFNVAVQPGSGDLWVANTEALNHVRFEPNLRGHFVDTRMTVVEAATGDRRHLDLNPHIDYGVSPGPPEERARSVAMPGDTRFSADGGTAYVAAFGSAAVTVIDTIDDSFDRIAVGGGPSGLALDESKQRLYVVNRFENSISIVDTALRQQVGTIGIAGSSFFDPTPQNVREGRRFLYDAASTSGHGDVACASCHVFGNFDGLGWDLGDPTGSFVPYGQVDWLTFFIETSPPTKGFHPMKGPMVTQTLRGLAGTEPFHWRGDRRDFAHFNGAFVSLMGTAEPLSTSDMGLFVDFAMSIRMPPNPYRTLDDGLPATIAVPALGGFGALVDADPSRGQDIYENGIDAEGTRNCITCHPAQIGTDGRIVPRLPTLESQDTKIAQLRNLYEKVTFARQSILGTTQNVGPPIQKSGFGVLHAGASSASEFFFAYFLNEQVGLDVPQDVEAFTLAFPTGTAPIVGRQFTVGDVAALTPDTDAMVELMMEQAALGNCDLVVQGSFASGLVGYVYNPASGLHTANSRGLPPVPDAMLRASLEGDDKLTYTAVPPGSGIRLGIDRDRDTWRDGDELSSGSNPADAGSFLVDCATNGPNSLAGAVLKMTANAVSFEDGKLSVRGAVDLAGRLTPPILLHETGMVLDVRDASDQSILQRRILPGAWRLRGESRWSYRDKSGALAAGITKIVVREDDGLFRFSIRGRGIGANVQASAFPLEMIVVFGAADQEAGGQCGRVLLPADRCRISRETLSCR